MDFCVFDFLGDHVKNVASGKNGRNAVCYCNTETGLSLSFLIFSVLSYWEVTFVMLFPEKDVAQLLYWNLYCI